MLGVIVVLFPTFITLNILKRRNQKDYKELLFEYPVYNIIINLITMMIVYLYKRNQIISVIDNFNIMNFCIKYLVIAVIIAIIIPYVKELITKNINYKIEIRRDKKKNEKKD